VKHLFTFLALGIFGLFGLTFMAPTPTAHAQATGIITGQLCDGTTRLDPTACSADRSTLGRVLSIITQTIVYVVGGISIIMIVIGGLRYVTSGGDPNTTKGAKDTILYAVIGVVVAIIAQGLVTFVLSRF
jgi:hypothetical protein